MAALHNATWGPALWMILHSSAERIGTKSLRRLPHEEARLWINLLSSLRFTLPCPLCKKHYSDYFQDHPLLQVTREAVREWLGRLHHAVNRRLHVNAPMEDEWSITRLEEVYSAPFHFSKHWAVVAQQMMQAFRGGWIKREDLQKTVRAMEELKRFYDFF